MSITINFYLSFFFFFVSYGCEGTYIEEIDYAIDRLIQGLQPNPKEPVQKTEPLKYQ